MDHAHRGQTTKRDKEDAYGFIACDPHLCREALNFFVTNVGQTIWLPTGTNSDRSIFEIKAPPQSQNTSPATLWSSVGPTADGLRNFFGEPSVDFNGHEVVDLSSSTPPPHNVGPGLGNGSNPEVLLDKVPAIAYGAAEVRSLVGKTVCFLVKDSDVSYDTGNQLGNFQGEYLGVIGVQILAFDDQPHAFGSGRSILPALQMTILDPFATCGSPATKTGEKFNDLNGNGTRDPGEPDVAGVEIRAYTDANNNNAVDPGETFVADTTGADGVYSFVLAPGEYVICEVLPTGSTQASPTGNTACAAVAGLAPDGHAITLTAGQTDAGNDFGNTTPQEELGSITIGKIARGAYRVFHFRFVFNDTIEQFRLGDGESTTFDGLAADEYVIREIDPDGWFLDEIDCNPGSDVDIKLEELTVTVNLRPGEDVVCTFVNEPGSGTSPQLPIQQPDTVVDQQQEPRILGDNIQAPSVNPQVGDPATADPAIDGLAELPRTGMDAAKLAIMAVLMIVLGLTLVAEQRRKLVAATAERPVR